MCSEIFSKSGSLDSDGELFHVGESGQISLSANFVDSLFDIIIQCSADKNQKRQFKKNQSSKDYNRSFLNGLQRKPNFLLYVTEMGTLHE